MDITTETVVSISFDKFELSPVADSWTKDHKDVRSCTFRWITEADGTVVNEDGVPFVDVTLQGRVLTKKGEYSKSNTYPAVISGADAWDCKVAIAERLHESGHLPTWALERVRASYQH